jgi:hypothetical protein
MTEPVGCLGKKTPIDLAVVSALSALVAAMSQEELLWVVIEEDRDRRRRSDSGDLWVEAEAEAKAEVDATSTIGGGLSKDLRGPPNVAIWISLGIK